MDRGNLLRQKPYLSAAKMHTECIILAEYIYLLSAKIVYFKYILAEDNLLTKRVFGQEPQPHSPINPVATEILFIA